MWLFTYLHSDRLRKDSAKIVVNNAIIGFSLLDNVTARGKVLRSNIALLTQGNREIRLFHRTSNIHPYGLIFSSEVSKPVPKIKGPYFNYKPNK